MAILDELIRLGNDLELEVTSAVPGAAGPPVTEHIARVVGGPLGDGSTGGDTDDPPDPPNPGNVIEKLRKFIGVNSDKDEKETASGDKGTKGSKGGKSGLPVDLGLKPTKGGDAKPSKGGKDAKGEPLPDGLDDVLDPSTVEGEVRWTLSDEAGQPIAEARWRAGTGAWQQGAPAGAVTGLTEAITLDLLKLVTYDKDANPRGITPPQVTLTVAVKLRAGDTETDWLELPPRTVPLPTLGLPTVAILFEHPNFNIGRDGTARRAMIMVQRENSISAIDDRDEFRQALDALYAATQATNLANGPLALLAGGLLKAQAAFLDKVRVVLMSEIPHLGIELDHPDVFTWHHAEDNFSSLILIGPPGRTLECYNARDFDAGEGHMNVIVGLECCVMIENLASSSPDSEPRGRVRVVQPPARTRWKNADAFHEITTFGDELSSIRFGRESVPTPTIVFRGGPVLHRR